MSAPAPELLPPDEPKPAMASAAAPSAALALPDARIACRSLSTLASPERISSAIAAVLAKSSARLPSAFSTSRSAPAPIKALTTCSWPSRAATMSAVFPASSTTSSCGCVHDVSRNLDTTSI
eukprot:CAMPEP_0178438388 /NCGR_PEP_ID=MMETSP0689_2-20121128/35565_1 /TAXON_ID=160604 /ORGANISM="Amphidinium massartii, Strain CS-259" /LENGTH=121 /DNA_ID=CAMNT_0020060785 /DNA_START=34 /DNA_END=399 /DNA_ORIENTATION=+